MYIRFSSSSVSARLVEGNRTIEEKPLIALRRKKNRPRIVAVGADASLARSRDPENVTVHNPFKHPRTFLSDFEVAEAALRHFMCRLHPRALVRPVVVLHPLEKTEGGITQVEYRGLVDLGGSIGGRKVYVYTGPTLDDSDLSSTEFLESQCSAGPNSKISEI